jgi:hypothetical protein
LFIDFNLLFHHGSLSSPFETFAILPPSLNYLHVGNIGLETFVGAVRPHIDDADKAINYMRRLVSIYPIPRLSITVDIEDEDGDSVSLVESEEVELLSEIAIALVEVGTVLEMYEESCDTDFELLVRGDE